MATQRIMKVALPAPIIFDAAPPSAASSFNVDSVGTGSFTGLSYTVPAHAKGEIKAAIQVMAITSADLADLNSLVNSMLAASVKTSVSDYQETHASADASLWGFFCGGASASYTSIHQSMTSSGLTEQQISDIIDKLFAIASQMSNVSIDFTIDNTNNDYDVSGDLELYTIGGSVSTSQGTCQFRFLANQGSAGNGAAPAQGAIIPLK